MNVTDVIVKARNNFSIISSGTKVQGVIRLSNVTYLWYSHFNEYGTKENKYHIF